jgi:hypothetical protein
MSRLCRKGPFFAILATDSDILSTIYLQNFLHVSPIILIIWTKMTALEFSISVFNSQEDNLKIIFRGQGRRIKFSVVSKDSELSCFWKRDYKLWPNYLPFSRKSKKHFLILDT